MESMKDDIRNLSGLKRNLPTQGPFSFEEQERISNYFMGVNLLIKKIDEHPKGKKGLKKYIEKKGLANLCQSILVSKPTWDQIEANCWKGEYFICSEDILDFEETIELFIRNLDESNKKRFLTNDACVGAWNRVED